MKSIFFAGETWQGKWQGNEIAAKVLALRECTPRISRDFNDEYPKLRIFSHPNVMPVIGCCNSPPNLVVISQYVPMGSLYQVLHEGSGLVVDAGKAIQFAIDIAKVCKYTQCGNFIIFPSLRFYVKSIWRILEVQNLPFKHI